MMAPGLLAARVSGSAPFDVETFWQGAAVGRLTRVLGGMSFRRRWQSPTSLSGYDKHPRSPTIHGTPSDLVRVFAWTSLGRGANS